ncbi:MAG TPA: asparagine synthase (glutamine-hydrolyzing) [Vicinamibacteria bacterium]|nr:asparagine synthase (glutamine-hydrolyzing) [Vicinamibacteria bacterium]
MCGIAGAIGPGADAALAAALIGRLRHRGPDDEGTWTAPPGGPQACLVSTRLAIIDLSAAGHMPMADERTGNVIAYNGEVYNFRELRAELEGLGERFGSGTDTEAVLKAYGRWGPECVARLQGMFAFAIWDKHRQELLLARDRLGEKPLYFAASEDGFAFASEVRALLASGRVARRVDVAALDDYLLNGFVVSPRTLAAGVRSLLPGHWMRVDARGKTLETRRYWRLPVPPPPEPRDLSALRDRLLESTRQRLISDVPLGAFLSGGLDSTTQVALMSRLGGDVRTFSITFDEAEFDESAHSSAAARRFGTRHTEVRLRRDRFEAWLPDAVAALDQPSFDGLNTYFVSRAARESGLTVAVGGSGADELFGGYPFFRWVPWLERLSAAGAWLPAAVRRVVVSALARPLTLAGPAKLLALWDAPAAVGVTGRRARAYQSTQTLFPSWSRRFLEGRAIGDGVVAGLPPEFVSMVEDELPADCSPLEAVSRLALRLFLGERCLRDADATSMAVSLELRAPFVDHALVEAALAYPASVRCRGIPDKPFAWELAAPFLGEGYPRRRKQGFIFPFERWLREGAALASVRASLSTEGLPASIGLDERAVRTLLRAFADGPHRIPWSRVWALHVVLDWCRRHGLRA